MAGSGSLASFLKSAGAPAAAQGSLFRVTGHNDLIANVGGKVADTSDEEQKLGSLKALQSVTRNRRAARKIARNKEAITTLLSSVKQRPRFAKLVEYSVECLKNLAVDEVSIEEMIDEGALEVLANVCKQNPYNEQIQKAVNQAIQAYCLNDYLAEKVGQKIGSENLLFSLRKHVEPETLVTTCSAIGQMMKCEKNVDIFMKGGLISALKHVVDTNPENADVIEAATKVCSKVAENPAYAQEIMQSGIVESVLNAMRNNPDEKGLVKTAAALLSKLANCGDSAVVDQLRRMGAIDALVMAVENNPDDKEMLALGAAGLKALAGDADLGHALNAISSGNNAMAGFMMAKVASLALVDTNVAFIVENGGIGKIVSAIQLFAKEDSDNARRVLESGFRALARLAINEQNIYSIMQHGGVKACISAMTIHGANERIATAALAMLSQLITRKENAEYILKCGGLAATLALMQQHPESEQVALHGLKILSALAFHDETVGAVATVQSISIVIGVMKIHLHNKDIITAAINFLGRCANSAQNIQAIVDCGGIPVLIDVLREHNDIAEIVTQDLFLIESLAMMPNNLAALRDNGAVDEILQAMENHPTDAQIQEIGARAIGLIAGEKQLQISVGNVKELAEKLMRNPQDAESILRVLGPAVRLLANLAMVADNVGFLATHGGTEALLRAIEAGLKLPPSEEREALLASACLGLVRMAVDPATRQKIVQSGYVKQMINHALKNIDNELLAEAVMNLVRTLAADPLLAESFIQDGTLTSLIELVKAHPLNEKILAAAVQALGALCTNVANATAVCQSGGSEVLVEAIYANMSNPQELNAVLSVISLMAADAACARLLVNAGTIEAILDAMKNHPLNAEIITTCIASLRKLMIAPEVAGLIGAKGGLPLLLKVLRDHYNNEPVVQANFSLLELLAHEHKNIDLMLNEDLGAIALVEWAAKAYTHNATIQQAAHNLLAALRGFVAVPVSLGNAVDIQKLSDQQAAMLLKSLTDPAATPAHLLSVLNTLAELALDPAHAELLVQQGGLQALAALLLSNKGNENIFKATAVALHALAKSGTETVLRVLQDPKLIEAFLEVLKPHSNFQAEMNAASIVSAMEALGKMCTSESNIQRLIQQGALKPLLSFFTSSNDPEVLKTAARVLAKISNDERSAELLAQMADIGALIKAMRTHFALEEFLRYAVYLLGNLAINDHMKTQIAIEGGVLIIIKCMQTYPSNKTLIDSCCFALGRLSYRCEMNISLIAACGGIEALIDAMGNFRTEVDLLDSAMCCICNLCYCNDQNTKRIVACKGAKQIVTCMLDNITHVDLLSTGLNALGSLASVRPNVKEIVREGGAQGVVSAMTEHGKNMDVINLSIRVLANLASDPDPEIMEIMSNEGAVQAIVDVSLAHTENADIELPAFACLCNFARNEQNSKMIVRQKGLDGIARALKSLSFDIKVSEAAVTLLEHLSKVEANAEIVVQGRAIPAMVDSMKEHRTVVAVLLPALRTIFNVSATTSTAQTLAKHGCVQAVLSVVKDHESDHNVLAPCFSALSELCRAENNATAMSEQVMVFFVQVLRNARHINSPSILQHAFAFLAIMCGYPTACAPCATTGLVQTVLYVLKQHETDTQLTLRVLRTLENLALSTNAVKDHLVKENVLQVMTEFKAAHKGRDDVAAAAQRVIDAINHRGAGPVMIERKAMNVRNLFGESKKEEPKVEVNLDEQTRNLLCSGQLMTKHSNTAPPRPRHVFITPDLKFLCWKNPKKPLDEKTRMKVYMIREIQIGRVTQQLQRKKRFGGYNAREDCCFAIFGRERTVDLECKTPQQRDKWIAALKTLVEYTKAQKKLATNFFVQ